MTIKIIKSRFGFTPRSSKSEVGFTLMELLIIIALLGTIAVAILVGINPSGQIKKGQDSKRKQELNQLSKALEDWFNDKGCYPKTTEICYSNDISGFKPLWDPHCFICGNESQSPVFPYLSSLPCDPVHPTKKYLYQVELPGNLQSCATWYRVYTILSNTTDPAIAEVGCTANNCPSRPGFNYGISSPNIGL